MDFSKVFSAQPFDGSRVGLWGLALMALGAAAAWIGPRIWPKAGHALKLVGLLAVAVGALGAMKIL